MVRRASYCLAALAALGWLVTVAVEPAFCQQEPNLDPFGTAEGETPTEAFRVQLPGDRISSRGVQRAEESIAKSEFTEALRFLDEILGSEEDIFVDQKTDVGVRGLKETARQMIRDLSPEGRRAYETAYAPVSQRLLKAAIDAGDRAALQQIAQRYFYTPAGYEAALLIALQEEDAGERRSAALAYQQLLDTPEAARIFEPQLSIRAAVSWLAAGDEARAQEIIATLAASGRQTIEIAGRQRQLDSPEDAVAWLREAVGQPADLGADRQRQWLTYRGNAARNAVSSGGLPHMRVRWDVQLLGPLGPPKLEALFENLAADRIQSDAVVPVAGAPLAVGDYILTRTLEGLLAVDFNTGKRVWRSEPEREPTLEALIGAGRNPDEDASHPERALSFARRMWDDYLYGQLSSDGDRAYLIRDLSMPAGVDVEMAPFMGGPMPEPVRQTNRLSAYELVTQGKLVWEIDGAVAEGDLSGSFFLGAPLAVGPVLYVLAEICGAEIYLIALDAETGKLQWRQQLAVLETDVTLDAQRRLQAAMPSYDDGMLVCLTGAGVTVGVDLSKRSLTWAYRYETAPSPEMNYRLRSQGVYDRTPGRWLDNAAAIADGRVILTPPESAYLHCIDLRTGKLLWMKKRDKMLRLACIEAGRVILVGNRKFTALKVADGKPAWSKQAGALPSGAAPSGSGFVSDGKYFLPLTSSQVIAVNLADGQIDPRAVARDGAPLGNLICHRGSVISQSGLSLDCFDQIDVLRSRSERKLEQDPANVEALRTLGEVAYNEGRLSDAIALLERAHAAAPDDFQAREVLAECLAAALDEDFASYRSRLPLLRLLDDGGLPRRMQILRVESQGLLAAGETLAAADACLGLYRLAGPSNELLAVKRDHQTTVGRWVQAQLAAIWQQATEADRQTLTRQFRAEQDKLGANPSGDALANFLEFFGRLPSMEPLRLAYAGELSGSNQKLESQQVLLDLRDSADEKIRLEATALLAAQLHDAGRHAAAATFDRELRGVLEPVVSESDLSGQELVNRWSEKAGPSVADWPRGRVEVTEMSAASAGAARFRSSPMWGLRLEHTDPILGLSSGHYSMQGSQLVLQDNLGREFFTAALDNDNQIHYRAQGSLYGVSRGSLLLVSMGRQLAAFNTLPTPEGAGASSLWRASIANNLPAHDLHFGEGTGASASRPGTYRAPRHEVDGKWLGVIGPLTSQGCVYQDQRQLICCDALTGEVRWSRSDVPNGCDLFGDDELVFAVPFGSTTAKIFSAIDGRALGEAEVPSWLEQLVTIGRHMISWKRLGGERMELASLDARTGKVAWRSEFESEAAIDVDLGRYVAVVEPSGRAVVIDGQDGAVVINQPVPAKPTVEEIHFTVGQDTFLIVAKHRRPGKLKRTVLSFNAIDSPVIDGQVYLFDRTTGKMRWDRPAEIVQQALLLNQPRDVPFLAFAGTLNPDGGAQRPFATVLVLDKASGRTIYQSDKLPQAGQPQCLVRVPDVSKPAAALELSSGAILLQFTDRRRPPEPPAMAEVEGDAGTTSRGLMGILEKIGS